MVVCMARLNVYVPDELAERARARGLNVSALTQAAITAELENTATDLWLEGLRPEPRMLGTKTCWLQLMPHAMSLEREPSRVLDGAGGHRRQCDGGSGCAHR